MRLLGLLLSLILLTCSKPNLPTILNSKIALFTEYENIYFKNISISPISREANQSRPKEFAVRKKGKPSFAAIQTVPEIRILKNYYSDTLTIDFVEAFSELDVTRLYNYDEGQDDFMDCIAITHLEFGFGKEWVILFRGSPYLSKDEAQMLIDNSTPLDGKWRFFIIPSPSK